MMGYMNGHIGRKNTNFKKIIIINFWNGAQKCDAQDDRAEKTPKAGTKLLKKY